MSFHFDPQQLRELGAAKHDEYVSARPFAHIVIDDFLPEAVLDEVLGEFPGSEADAWWRFESEKERKLASNDDTAWGEATRHLLAELNSAAFIDFLGEMTGIQGLVPDPHFAGGGLHQIVRGGHLDVHVDFNRHPLTGLDRRLNALIYLNRDWPEEYGGALELWSERMERCEQRILPLFNRLVVFSTTETSYHGHPHPVTCPQERARRSLALYYYSRGRPEEDGASADTHSTVWAQPGVDPHRGKPARERVKRVVRGMTPPVLYDAARSARRRRRAGV